MATYYLKSVIGLDTNDGSEGSPWLTIAKANATCEDGDTLVIDTTAGPLYMDAAFVANGVNVIGVGTRSVPEVGSKLADIRCWKRLAKTFTQPDAATYPNIWFTTDTGLFAGVYAASFFEEVDWTGSAIQPIKFYSHANGANFAAVASAINSTPGKYWSDGTTGIYFSTLNGANPNLDDITYCRSRPELVTNYSHFEFSGSRLSNICIGGSGRSNTAGTSSGPGACWTQHLNDDRSSVVENLFVYGGHLHNIVLTTTYAESPVTVDCVEWRRVVCEQMQPSIAEITIMHVDYVGIGSTIRLRKYIGCKTLRHPTGVFGSTQGAALSTNGNDYPVLFSHGGGTIHTWFFDGCDYFHQIRNDDTTINNMVFMNCNRVSQVRPKGSCTATFRNCNFPGVLPSKDTGTVVFKFYNCVFDDNFSYGNIGACNNLTIDHCLFNVVNTPENFSSPSYFKLIGGSTATVTNNLIIHNGWNPTLIVEFTSTDTVILDYNYYVSGRSTAGFSSTVWQTGKIDSVVKTFAQMQTAGYEAHSTLNYSTNGSYITALLLDANYVPAAGSTAKGKANTVGYDSTNQCLTTDATGNVLWQRTTVGPYEAGGGIVVVDAGVPEISDVVDGVVYDNGKKVGNVVIPSEINVRIGTGYGAGGTEYDGELKFKLRSRI